MRKQLSFVFLLPFMVQGQPPPGYYDPAQGLTSEALRIALHDIIDGHQVLANSSLWSAYGQTDRKPNNTVWDIYSDVPDGTPPYEFTFVTDQCGNYSGEGDCFNREHTFPQSWFNGAPPMDTDLFHLYPTDAWVNQRRANWPYGEVGSPTWTSQNGSKLGPCNYPGCSGTVFEPIGAYKGDLARGYFYLLTRYYGITGTWPSPMLMDGEFLPWAETMLLDWHAQDPVSDKEVARNNIIFTNYQGNRNPYIDHPEWVERIWGPTASVPEHVSASFIVRTLADGIEISRTTVGSASLQLFDARGALLATKTFSGSSVSVPIQLANGAYVVVLDEAGSRQVQRFVR